MTDPQEPRRRLGLTTRRQTAVSALAGALLAAFLLSLFDLVGGFPPVVPWSVPAVLAVMAIGAVLYARILRRRLDEHAVSGQEAVAALAIAKSMVMAGAVLAGMHAVYVGWFVAALPAATPVQRVVLGSVTLVVSLLFAGAGYLLEKECVVRGPDEPDEDAEDEIA